MPSSLCQMEGATAPVTPAVAVGGRTHAARWLGAGLVALLALTPAWSLDLLQAYEAAETHDATLRAARAAADAARERVPQARAQLLPNVAFSAGRTYNDLTRTQTNLLGKPTTTDETYYSHNQSLQLRQPLFRKALWAGLEQAHALAADGEAALEREWQNLGVRVASAYLELLLAHDQLDLVLKQREVTQTQLDAAHKLLAAGNGTRTDVDEAQARLDLNRAQELEAHQQLLYTQHQLQTLMDRPVGGVARLDPAKMTLAPPQPATLDGWLALAEASSPELQAGRARLESTRHELTKAQAGHYPTLDAVAQVTRSASENVSTPSSSHTNRSLGLQLNVPLFAGGYIQSQVRQALAEQTRAEELLEATRRDLAVRLHREYRGVTEGVLKVRALEQAVRSAEQVTVSSRRSREAGVRTLLDVLNAEEKLQLARRDLAQARYAAILAQLRLHALAGSDKRAELERVNAWLVPTEGAVQ